MRGFDLVRDPERVEVAPHRGEVRAARFAQQVDERRRTRDERRVALGLRIEDAQRVAFEPALRIGHSARRRAAKVRQQRLAIARPAGPRRRRC
jgi:hypothetical protein